MPITIAPTVLPRGARNAAYSQTVAASGGTPPYSYSIVAGALPAGLTLNAATGVISGTPTVSSTYTFTVRATDAVPATGDQAYTLVIAGTVYWYICTRSAYPSAIPPNVANQQDFNRRVASGIASASKARRNVGDLLARPVVKPVNDHLLCDGSAVSRTSFPQLYDEIGTEWGIGDGSTTFNIPNFINVAIPVPASAPAQTITTTTSSTGEPIVQPTTPAMTGGTSGGNISTGGRSRQSIL